MGFELKSRVGFLRGGFFRGFEGEGFVSFVRRCFLGRAGFGGVWVVGLKD